MASRIAGIGPSPRLLFLCFLPLALLIVVLAMDQYVRQRSSLLTDLAGVTNDQHSSLAASLAGAGPQLARLRLTMGLDYFKPAIGLVAVIDGQGKVISINGKADQLDRARLQAYLIVENLLSREGPDTGSGGFESLDGYRILTRNFANSSYRLLHIVPDSELRAALLPRFAPYALILLGLAATIAGIFYFLHRAYILPSLRLARYISDQASGAPSRPPVLPAKWQQQLGLVTEAFASGRLYQSQLEESEARFLAATSSLRDGFAIIGPDGKLAFYNEALERHLSEEQRQQLYLGRDVREFIDQAWMGSNGVDIEAKLDDGRWITGRQSKMPDGGRVIMLRDITDAKLAELTIRDSEARYRKVVETQTEMVARYDPAGRTTFANDAYCRYLGIELKDMLARTESDFDLVIPEDRERHLKHIASLTPENPTATIVIRSLLKHNGKARWEEWTDTGIFGEDGKLVEIQSIGRDVTEKKLAEEALGVSEGRMSAFLNYAPVAMLAKDNEGRFTMANPEALRRLRRSREEVIGKQTSDLLPPNEAADMDRSIARVLATGEMQVEEQYHPSLAPFLHSLFIRFPLRSQSGEITGAGVFVVDQTREKQAVIELDNQRHALHQSEKLAALGSLLAGVAHELNNPLSIVVGYAGMLHEMAPDEATRRRTYELQSAAERCARIVKTFLSMARSKPIEKKNVDIDAVIDDVLELGAYGLRSNGVTVTRVRAENLPPTLADPDQLHQVFMNVVLNAQQAMMNINGPRILDVRTQYDGENIAIEISDSGHGVPDEIKLRVFDPFFTTKPQGVGTGIGLSVSLKIIQAHEGTIGLETIERGRTVCRITLPVAQAAGTVLPDRLRPTFSLTGKVLVVDDEAAIAHYVRDVLVAEGLDVTAVTSGREAQALLRKGEFDAVITDLRMPDISGEQLIAFIAEKRSDLVGKVIVMTGDALGPEVITGNTGVPVLVKPLEMAVLRDLLRPLLSAKAGVEKTEEVSPDREAV